MRRVCATHLFPKLFLFLWCLRIWRMHPFHFSFVIHFAVLTFTGNGAHVQDISVKRHRGIDGLSPRSPASTSASSVATMFPCWSWTYLPGVPELLLLSQSYPIVVLLWVDFALGCEIVKLELLHRMLDAYNLLRRNAPRLDRLLRLASPSAIHTVIRGCFAYQESARIDKGK